MTVKISSIRSTSVFQYVAASLFAAYLCLAVFFGLLGTAGCNTVHWNREAIHGIWALPFAILICMIMWLFSTLFVWLALSIGFPLFRMIYPVSLEAEVASDDEPQSPKGPIDVPGA
jgi:hypothetical protein